MTHPHVLHALAALWSLHRAQQLLAEHRDAVALAAPRRTTSTRQRTLAELTAMDTLLRQERPDRFRLAGARVAASPAPAPVAVLDALRDADRTLADTAALLAHVHRHRPLLRWTRDWDQPAYAGRWVWLIAAASVAPHGIAREIHALVDPVDARARAITGHGPDLWRLPLSPPCPACGLRLLRVHTSPPDSRRWAVVCGSACRCGGEDCGCGMPVREARVRHIWPADHALVADALRGVELAA